MHIDDIKRGLRAEIKKRENEQYATFQCNVRQMCKDVLAKLEEQESEIAELKADYKEACDRLQTANLIKDEQKKKADILLSRLKHIDLVMHDLIKDCPSKKTATEIVKEYDVW